MEPIDEMKFITDWYARLCAKARQRAKADPSVVCQHCGHTKKDHGHDLRCSISVCTTNYRAVDQEMVDQNQNTIAAIEALAVVREWTLA